MITMHHQHIAARTKKSQLVLGDVFQFLAFCQVLYVPYEQCSTDSLNKLNVTATKRYEKIKKLMSSNILVVVIVTGPRSLIGSVTVIYNII